MNTPPRMLDYIIIISLGAAAIAVAVGSAILENL
jgi:hypothetical protein